MLRFVAGVQIFVKKKLIFSSLGILQKFDLTFSRINRCLFLYRYSRPRKRTWFLFCVSIGHEANSKTPRRENYNNRKKKYRDERNRSQYVQNCTYRALFHSSLFFSSDNSLLPHNPPNMIHFHSRHQRPPEPKGLDTRLFVTGSYELRNREEDHAELRTRKGELNKQRNGRIE